MDENSVTRPAQPSTKAIVADEGFCAQAAALLFCDRSPIHDAFIGEPVEDVLEMVRWALSHQDDEGFDPARVLTSWARRRGRGVWSDRPRTSPTVTNPNGELAEALVRFWTEHPEELVAVLDRVQTTLNGSS